MNWLHVALLALFIIGSVVVAPNLPDRIPLHYGLDGRIDATAPSSSALWYVLPVGAVAMALFFRGLAALAREADTWKLGEDDLRRFRGLPNLERVAISETVIRNFSLMSVAMSLVLVAIQVGNYMVAITGSNALPMASWLTMLAAIALIVIVSLRHDRDLKKRIRSPG